MKRLHIQAILRHNNVYTSTPMQNFFELASRLSEEKCLHSHKVLKMRWHKEWWSPEWRAEIEGARGIVGMIVELHTRAKRARWRSPIANEVYLMWSIYEIIHFWTAVVEESEEWSSQYIFQFKQLERRSLKKIRASTGFEPVTSALPMRCSTNWAMKPHIGSEVNW